MKKVMIVGGEDLSFRLPYMQQLKRKGFSVVAVGSQCESAFSSSGIPYVRYSLNRWVNPLDDIKTIKKLRKIIKQHQPDVVHGFDTKPAVFSLCASIFLPIKVGRTINGTGQIFSERSIKNKILQCIYWTLQSLFSWKASFTIFQNEQDKTMFESVLSVNNSNNYLIKGSGIDCKPLPVKDNYSSSPKQIILVSRMLKNKGVYEYMEAARRVKATHADCKFLLIGPLSSEGRFAVPKEDIDAYSSVVDYLGASSEVKEIMFNSDLMVLPTTYREGVPRVLLEAGAIGLPLLTTNMPGCSDLVKHGENGWLIAPHSVDELEKAIVDFLDCDSIQLERMGKHNVSLIRENYSMDVVLAKNIDIYSSLF